ncbi:unnamed protein product [Cuscuta europaea]|uniref:Uncharacterized protein n=1 Tax=Cuscuta europaea TaxID=41803 RepID=A0A9P0ZJ13_CUSEU|nr:unnamed protein product [Cuscuta europaea]
MTKMDQQQNVERLGFPDLW